jgi:hypothetical protein
MQKETLESIDRTFIKCFEMPYSEFEELDYDEQQRLFREYHKKHPNKSKDTLVMFGGGDESIFKRVKKGTEICTPNGYFIAGETLEENNKRWEKMKTEGDYLYKLNKIKDKEKLDLKTWLYLFITNTVKVTHPKVVEVESKRTMYVKDSKKNEVYIFKDYNEYKNYFLMYLDDISDDVIDLAIYTRSSKGQIIAFKGLCEHIIIKKKINDFYNSITEEQINEIHAKGKLTPLEAVQMWESLDLCIEGNKSLLCKNRCEYFNKNCHDCLMEKASHKLEHDKIEYDLDKKLIKSNK